MRRRLGRHPPGHARRARAAQALHQRAASAVPEPRSGRDRARRPRQRWARSSCSSSSGSRFVMPEEGLESPDTRIMIPRADVSRVMPLSQLRLGCAVEVCRFAPESAAGARTCTSARPGYDSIRTGLDASPMVNNREKREKVGREASLGAENFDNGSQFLAPLEGRTRSPLLDAGRLAACLTSRHTWVLAQARANRIPHYALGAISGSMAPSWTHGGGVACSRRSENTATRRPVGWRWIKSLEVWWIETQHRRGSRAVEHSRRAWSAHGRGVTHLTLPAALARSRPGPRRSRVHRGEAAARAWGAALRARAPSRSGVDGVRHPLVRGVELLGELLVVAGIHGLVDLLARLG